MKKRVLSTVLVLCILMTLLPVIAAASFTDMPNDYSTAALEAAVENGLLNGSDGKILPNDNLTRAQMAAIIVRAFGAMKETSLSGYTDVFANAWYYPYMAKAVHMKVLQGDGTRLMPNDPITRQQAFTVLARALKLEDGTRDDLAAFSDVSSIANWAVGPTAALVKAGFIHGSGGKLNPTSNILRKDFAVMMHNIFKKYITQAGTVTSLPEGNVLVNVPGVTLKGVTVKGDLIIGDGVASGDVILDNVTVTGRMVVRGGGVNSVIIRGASSVGTVIVSKVDGNVRIFVEGNADVEVVYIEDGNDDVIVEGAVDKLVVNVSDIAITVKGTVDDVTVTGAKATLIVEGTVGTLTTTTTASSASVQVAEGGHIDTIYARAAGTQVSGEGTVGEVLVTANNVRVDTVGTYVTAAAGTTGVKAGDKDVNPGETEEVEEDKPAGGGGGGGGSPGGGGGGSPAALKGIEVTGVAEVGETLTARVDPSNAAVTYQWQRADAEAGTYTDIPGATESTYRLTMQDAGKWIRVKATGKESTTGTATSGPLGRVIAVRLSWAQVQSAEAEMGSTLFSSENLTIQAIKDVPFYLAVQAENVAGSALQDARTVIVGEGVDDSSFDMAIAYAYIKSGGVWTPMQNAPRVEYDNGHYFEMNGFEAGARWAVVIRLTPKVSGSFEELCVNVLSR